MFRIRKQRMLLLLGSTARASLMLAFVAATPTLIDTGLPGVKNFTFVSVAQAGGWGDSGDSSDGGNDGGDSGNDGGDSSGGGDSGNDSGDDSGDDGSDNGGGWGDDGSGDYSGGDSSGDNGGDDGTDSGNDGGDGHSSGDNNGHDHSKHQKDDSGCVDTPDTPSPPSRNDHDSKKQHRSYVPCGSSAKTVYVYQKWHVNCYW